MHRQVQQCPREKDLQRHRRPLTTTPFGSHDHRFTVRLPVPLRVGEKHEYGVRFTAFPKALMPPYYVMTPLKPCERFHVRVRFGDSVPSRIWRVEGMPPSAVMNFERADGLLTLDQHGEVSIEFFQLYQGLSYGVRWST